MAERGRGATDLASLDTRSQELRRQIQEMKAKKKNDARRESRHAKAFFAEALCLLALSGSRTDILVRFWRRCGDDVPTAESKANDVITTFLAMEPVAVGAMLDAETGPGAVALKEAVAFLLAQETLSWVRAQNESKGIAPTRRFVLQAREKLRLRMSNEANPSISRKLKLRSKAAAYKWAQRWRQAWRISSGVFHARKVLTPSEMRRKVFGSYAALPRVMD